MTGNSVQLTGRRHEAARDLIAAVVDHARGRGVDQATLARRAGISPESLSRLKREGRCRLSTALDLALAAGLTRLDLVAEPARPRSAGVCAQKLSAGRRAPISTAELVHALSTGRVLRRHRGHLCGFFEELPIELVHDVILDEGLEYAQLLALANKIDAEGETIEWIEEMAGDGLAGAA